MFMNTIFWTLLTALCSPFLFLWSLRPRSAHRRCKILIIQWAKLGDMVCTTPMFRAIKQAHPDWEVHVLCRKQSAVVLENNRFINRVIIGGSRGEMIRTLRHERYDAVINCLPGAFFSLLGLWCGARDRINTFSYSHGLIVRLARIFNTVNREYRIGTSTFAHYLSLLTPLRIPAIPYKLDFFPSKGDEHRVEEWLRKHGLAEKSFVIFNVSAGNVIKEWPEKHFIDLADAVVERYGFSIVISSLDHERYLWIEGGVKHPQKILDGSMLTLGQLGALCKKTAAFVAVDTGPMFIAHAVSAPMAVIVGGSDPREQIPPAGPKVVHVMPPAGCEPWMHVTLSPRQATEEQLKCVRETSVDAVMAALVTLL